MVHERQWLCALDLQSLEDVSARAGNGGESLGRVVRALADVVTNLLHKAELLRAKANSREQQERRSARENSLDDWCEESKRGWMRWCL